MHMLLRRWCSLAQVGRVVLDDETSTSFVCIPARLPKGEIKCGTLISNGVHPNLPAVPGDDALDYGKLHASALEVFSPALEYREGFFA